MLAIVGYGALTAAKIVGEIAHAVRFRSKDTPATTAPHRRRCGRLNIGNTPHRLGSSTVSPPLRELLERRRSNGDGGMEALRILKRRLSDVVYRTMITDQIAQAGHCLTEELGILSR